MPRGTSLGERNATQKNTTTTSAATIARSIGLVKLNDPMAKNGFHSKSCRPGAGNPHPLKMWQPPLASTPTSPVTGHLLFSPGGTTPPVTPPILGGSRSPQTPSAILRGSRSPQTPSAVAVNDEAERDGQAHQHADGEQQRYVDGPADQPADGAVGRHPREQVAEHRPAAVCSGSTYSILTLIAVMTCAALQTRMQPMATNPSVLVLNAVVPFSEETTTARSTILTK